MLLGKDLEDAYDEGYYIGVINTADEMSRRLTPCASIVVEVDTIGRTAPNHLRIP